MLSCVTMRLMRHIRTCNNAVLPGGRVPLTVDGVGVGWMTPAVADLVGAAAITAGALPALGVRLAAAGLFAWRDEPFDVRATPDGPALGTIDRGALPALGMLAVGAHLNGLVHRSDGPWLWVARRAATKLLDPGKLDHIAAGGVAAGSTPWETLLKEAEEEAEIPPALTATARAAGTIDYTMGRPEGLRRDRLHVYDLDLPASFQPRPADGEVAGFELWPLPEILERLRVSEDFKFNVNLVLIDLVLRRRLVTGDEGRMLRTALPTTLTGCL